MHSRGLKGTSPLELWPLVHPRTVLGQSRVWLGLTDGASQARGSSLGYSQRLVTSGKAQVFIPPVGRLARFRQIPRKQISSPGVLAFRVGGAAGGKRSSAVHRGTQWAPGPGSGCPYPGEWEMSPWERLH